MKKLCEMVFNVNNNTFYRYKENGKVEIKPIHPKAEYYYKTISTGDYVGLLDSASLKKDTKYKKDYYASFNKIDVFLRDEVTEFNKKPAIFYLDIETRVGVNSKGFPCILKTPEEVVCIQIYNSENDKYYIISDKTPKDDKKFAKFDNVEWIAVNSEGELFEEFFTLIRNLKPLIVTAAHGSTFDFPYIFNRIERIGKDVNNLSILKTSVTLTDKDVGYQTKYTINSPATFWIDLIDVYKTFIVQPRQNYTVDYLAEHDLGENKMSKEGFLKFDDMYSGVYTMPLNPTPTHCKSDVYNAAKKYGSESKEVKDIVNDMFLYYSIMDVYLIKEIDNKNKLLQTLIGISERMSVNIDGAMSTIKPWSNYISNWLYKQGKIIKKVDNKSDEKNEGGFVRETKAGLYSYVGSEDVSSMYPLLSMVSQNMSPEKYIPIKKLPEDLRVIVETHFNNENEDGRVNLDDETWRRYTKLCEKYNLSGSITGAIFKKDERGVIPTLIQDVYNLRSECKDKSIEYKDKFIKTGEKKYEEMSFDYDIQQRALKRAIVSVYGAICSPYFPLFNIEIARAITGNGRYFIKTLANNINNRFNTLLGTENIDYCPAGDTDSVYFVMEDFVKKAKKGDDFDAIEWCDKFIKKVVEPIVKNTIDNYTHKLNSYAPEVVACDREVIADRAAFFAKKSYIMSVMDNEGVRLKTPEIKMTGVDLKKSAIPDFIKKEFEKVVDIILYKGQDELYTFIDDAKKRLRKAPIYTLAKNIGVSNINYTLGAKSIPINSRASIVYNKFIKENGIDSRFKPIEAGDKIKLIYLKMPNKFMSNAIAFNDETFAEEYLTDCVDYNVIWDKFFISSLCNMTTPVGLSTERKDALLGDF